jgi:hypothetical protein
MRRIVPVPIRCPSRTSSPWTRRCPQRGFSRASRRTNSSWPVGVGPFPGDQTAMPRQQCARCHDAVPAQFAGQ